MPRRERSLSPVSSEGDYDNPEDPIYSGSESGGDEDGSDSDEENDNGGVEDRDDLESNLIQTQGSPKGRGIPRKKRRALLLSRASSLQPPTRRQDLPRLQPERMKILYRYPAEQDFDITAVSVVHEDYKSLLRNLCQATGFANDDHMVRGLEQAPLWLENTALLRAFRRSGEWAPLHIAVVIFLRVCARAWLAGHDLLAGTLASKVCFALVNVALEKVGRQLSKEGLIHWEERLLDADLFQKDWYLHVQPCDIIKTPRNEHEEFYMECLGRLDFDGMVKYIFDKEMEIRSSPLRKHVAERPALEENLWRMLASMNRSVIKYCITGQIPRVLRISCRAQRVIEKYESYGDELTAQYGNWETDGIGMSGTAYQYHRVTIKMERYLKENPTEADSLWAAAVDNLGSLHGWNVDWTVGGYRRYMDSGHKGNLLKKSQDRRKTTRSFWTALRRRCQAEINAGRGDYPLGEALSEIGFSKEPMTRQSKHSDRDPTSNYLMGLTDALLEAEYGEGFGLTQAVLLPVWNPTQCWLGEIALTYICQATPEHGYGFSHWQPGLSNRGAHFSHTAVEWDNHVNEVLDKTALKSLEEAYEARAAKKYRRERNAMMDLVILNQDENNRITKEELMRLGHQFDPEEQRSFIEAELRKEGYQFDPDEG